MKPHSALIVTLTLLTACGGADVGASGGGVEVAAAADAEIDFGSVPAFRLTSHLGQTITEKDLAGRPWVAAAIFTSCSGPCPRISNEMARLQEELRGTDALLVSVSVDPGHDSPQVLRAYAEAMGADPERWLFLTGPEAEVDELVRNGFKLGVARLDGDEIDRGLRVTHGTKLLAVDRTGRIRGWYESQTDEGVAALRARMLWLARETT